MSLIIGLDHVNLLIDAGEDALSRARAFYKKSRRHPAFRVANLEALRQKLETAGIEIIAGNRFPGQERFFVRDPWGNRLEFVERTGR
jgi:catechol 2,3-dioxygenase-like lactoylglutathione lyase family enzyme